MQRQLLKLLKCCQRQFTARRCQTLTRKLAQHGGGEDFVLDLEGAPQSWQALLNKVKGKLRKESCLAGTTRARKQSEFTTAQALQQLVVKLKASRRDPLNRLLVHDPVQNLVLQIAQGEQVRVA